ncbi:MAG: PilZ domain-containing protein [Phycisphaerales bacterium]
MAETGGLTIRQHVRHDLDMRVEFVIDSNHQRQVAFASSAGVVDTHTLAARTLDLSAGGAGLSSQKFLPRGCRGTLRILDPKPVSYRPDGSPVHEVMFEHRVQVRRVYLTGHEPSYFLGLTFLDPEPNLSSRIDDVFKMAEAHDQFHPKEADAA